MSALECLILQIARGFTMEAYLLSTKIQAIAWSCADILIVLMLLRIASLARSARRAGVIRYRFLLLWATALLTPALLLTRTPRELFVLESLICGLQFALLLYTLIRERALMLAFVQDLRAAKGSAKRS